MKKKGEVSKLTEEAGFPLLIDFHVMRFFFIHNLSVFVFFFFDLLTYMAVKVSTKD